jgi:ABC-type multidrug transport system fused ATPase/permease subunit
MKYHPKLPLVLKGINLEIKPGEKFAFVGRTGAGKSSIISSLFRFYDIDNQNNSYLKIDDIDIRLISL